MFPFDRSIDRETIELQKELYSEMGRVAERYYSRICDMNLRPYQQYHPM